MRDLPKPDLRLMAEMKQGLETVVPQAIADLESIGATVDASRLFVSVVANLLIPPPPHIAATTLDDVPSGEERLAYHLYPFFDAPCGRAIAVADCHKCVELLGQLTAQSMMLDLVSSDTGGQDAARDLAGRVRAFSKMVRGSAYAEQTGEEIDSIQGRFEDWFDQKLGIGPKKAHRVLWAIAEAQGRNIQGFMPGVHDRVMEMIVRWNEAKRQRPRQRNMEQNALLQRFNKWEAAAKWTYEEAICEVAPDRWPVRREDLEGDGMPPTLEEWEGLLGMLGLTQQVRAGMNDLVDIRERPLYVLPDGRVLLVNISHALDVLWERLDKATRDDQPFYFKRYQPVKADWLERRVTEFLSRIFPPDRIYQSLSYPDPDKPAGSTAELDIAVTWGPFLLLVEAKAKQFRMASQLGDIAKLRTDLRENIEDAFEQARRAVRYIDAVAAPEFTEIKTGRKLVVNRADLRRTYLLTVSLHDLAGLATQMASLCDLNLFRDGEFPLSMSIADLDIISQFCDGPDVLLHYMERRLDVQKNASEVYGNELDLFGAYLNTRLQPQRLWKEEGRQYHRAMLMGWSEQFDQWMEYRRGERDEAPDIRLKVPSTVGDILKELRCRDDDAARWIAFALLDMPDDVLGVINEFLQKVRQQFPRPGMFGRSAYQHGDVVVAFVASFDLPMPLLYQRTQMRAQIEKYRRKVSKCVCFGVALNNPHQPFEYACWIEGEWKHDDAMERLIDAEPPFVPREGSKMPGSNDPCICGSGKKYKKCCRTRIENSRRILS